MTKRSVLLFLAGIPLGMLGMASVLYAPETVIPVGLTLGALIGWLL